MLLLSPSSLSFPSSDKSDESEGSSGLLFGITGEKRTSSSESGLGDVLGEDIGLLLSEAMGSCWCVPYSGEGFRLLVLGGN